jgi:hypothetical protein
LKEDREWARVGMMERECCIVLLALIVTTGSLGY